MPRCLVAADWSEFVITSGETKWALCLNVNDSRYIRDELDLFLAHHEPKPPDDEPELITGESSL